MSQNGKEKRPQNVRFKGAGFKKAQTSEVALIPNWLLYPMFFISFSLPNLVFSGRHWFDTLHIMKWTVTMVPVGIVAVVAGLRLAWYGAKRTRFVMDPFGAIWLLLLLLITLQPAIIRFSSISTYVKEWFYFACLFAVYLLSYNSSRNNRFHRVLLWGGNVNAAINVLFAELLIRHANKGFPFILDVPGNYIGNTAQQEMFGLWMAMAVLNALYLHLYYVGETREGSNALRRPVVLANLFTLAVVSWGLWSSTARGAILSLVVAFVVLLLGLWRSGNKIALRRSVKLFGVVLVFLALVLGISSMIGTGRGNALVSKMMDMVQNPTSVGARISIWRTSWEVFLKEPVTGVGLGQYKWHFLDGQRLMFQKHPELLGAEGYGWQYTYWAHSEYIQWLCETGVIGALLLLGLALWWLYRFGRTLIRGEHIPPEALWGCAMVFLLWFDALFSRPFHRIENSVWMALAFALANRSILSARVKWTAIDTEFVYRGFGVLVAGISMAGFVFLAGGISGDQLIYKSIAQQSGAQEKLDQLREAGKYMMSRDDASEQVGHLLIQVGKLQQNAEIFSQGLQQLYSSFAARPTSKLLFELLNYAKQLNNAELLNALTRYLNPGMYGAAPPPEASAP